MKKTLSIICLATIFCLSIFAEQPKHEFRATWLATVSGIDWPKTRATNDTKREQQKQELIDILDKMKAGNMNAVCMQVRSLCDAMYESSHEPWSEALTGTRGKDPGYDPLAFALEEAHKRGMELHVWVNPFRASTGSLSSSDVLWSNAGDWLIKYNNDSFSGYIIDPGFPESRAYVVKVLMEIVNKYDIDGMVMDDYFYAYGGTETTDLENAQDAKSIALHFDPLKVTDINQNGLKIDDWRRSNVDKVIKAMYDTIQTVKPWVRFGMGPGGIWTMDEGAARAYGLTLPYNISGGDIYNSLYCNTVEWIKGGYVDYVNPQIYWSTTAKKQAYGTLCQWWSKDVCEHFSDLLPDGKRVHHFPSPAAYKIFQKSDYTYYEGYEDGYKEIQREMDANRANLSSGYTGAVFYNTSSYLHIYQQLAKSHFIYTALTPPMDWKVKKTLNAPTNLKLTGTTLTWSHPTETRFTVYAYPKGTGSKTAASNPIYLQAIVYGNSFNTSELGSLDNTTIAVYTYDRYGVEHAAAFYNEDTNANEDDPEPVPTPDITWVLNGGVLPTAEIPNNQQLWEQFKADFDEFYSEIYPQYLIQDYPINAVLELTWPKWSSENFAIEFMTQHPDWLWLADYIQSIAGTISDTKNWRYNLYAFFNATDQVCYQSGQVISWAPCGDFTIAGKPEAWGEYYLSAKGAVILPEYVSSEYTLPTNLTHPAGYPFLGWWDNATFIGAQIYSIPAYWKGTLYANWEGWNRPTSIENIDWNQPVEIYNLLGHRVNNLNQTKGNVLIIKQGNKTYKLIN